MVGGERTINPIERFQMLARFGAAHDDFALAHPREIKSVQGMAEFHEHVVRHVGDVIDGPLAHRLQALLEPFGRRLHLHVLDDPAAIARAEIRVGNLDGNLTGGGPGRFLHREFQGLQRPAVERRHFPRHAVVAEAVGPVRRHLDVEHPVVVRRDVRLGVQPDHRQVAAQLARIVRNVNEFLKPT
ncbi:MAG: hypothetical protein ABSG54_16660 [Terriglobia bacterium]